MRDLRHWLIVVGRPPVVVAKTTEGLHNEQDGDDMRGKLLVLAAIAAAWVAMIATAAIASAESAGLTIARLEAEGFDVKVNRVGSAPLDQCVVTDIRNPREETRLVRRGDDLIRVVVARRISVTADCSR